MAPFAVEYLAPRGGLFLSAKRELSIEIGLDVDAWIDLVLFLPSLGAPVLHHQPTRRFGRHERDDEQRESGDGCRPEHQSPIAACG
jgi:hypothetical protein